ncbi:MAG: ribonuclease J [Pseudomonadales bacterium]|jgi:ribonuclease J|nr:ribonuclease J [Pseudomonadales bacterium]
MADLKIFPLGGIAKVTQNMFLYTYEDEILIVDCGIGFPDFHMPGVDILIPDINYLQDEVTAGKKIVGMALSHGHDDHIGALPYLLDQLPELTIYASSLTAGFAKNRMSDGAVQRDIVVLKDREVLQLGQYFKLTSFAMTHSVPDTKHFLIETPVGNIYHGSDFKIDKQPIDGIESDYEFIKSLKERGIALMLMDCLGVEKDAWGLSESVVGPNLDALMERTKGKFVVTLMSSHVHRIQQIINSAAKYGRRVALVGRSVEQNIATALQLKKISDPEGVLIDKKKIKTVSEDKLCLIVAGSQGQEGSSMMRAIYGEHSEISITAKDLVVFSAEAIPGNEINYYGAIDELSINGVETIYPAIDNGIHQSGHGKRQELAALLEMVMPKMVMPIGGSNRHRVKFGELVAKNLGYKDEQVVLPNDGDILNLSAEGKIKLHDHIHLRSQIVDGLGIGDVGPAVLSDRRALGQAGIILIVIKRYEKDRLDLDNIVVVSRGFVFMKDAKEVIDYIKRRVAEIVTDVYQPNNKVQVERAVEKRLAKNLYTLIKREPMIEVEIVDC